MSKPGGEGRESNIAIASSAAVKHSLKSNFISCCYYPCDIRESHFSLRIISAIRLY